MHASAPTELHVALHTFDAGMAAERHITSKLLMDAACTDNTHHGPQSTLEDTYLDTYLDSYLERRKKGTSVQTSHSEKPLAHMTKNGQRCCLYV